jgi:hypothetical protein
VAKWYENEFNSLGGIMSVTSGLPRSGHEAWIKIIDSKKAPKRASLRYRLKRQSGNTF